MRWETIYLNANLTRESADGNKDGIFGPGKRWGHTCNSVRGGNLLYVFGGYGQDSCQTNDVFVFDTTRQTWSKPTVKGNPPPPRDSHSCTTVGNSLFVFGGTNGRNPLKDLHILDTSSNTWLSPSLRGDCPEAREGHSAALVGKRLFVFGGCGTSNGIEVYFDDLCILDTETLVWRRGVTSGKKPSARDSHTCSSWKNKLIVVAGEDASDSYLSDVHILDTDTLVWKQLTPLGQKLPPRAGHSTVALGRFLFVFGGFTDERSLYDDLHMLNLETGIWTKVLTSGQGPSARFSVAGDCLDPRKGILVFIGGCSQDLVALDDMYYMHTDIVTENGQDEPKPEKLSLRKELKRKCQEEQCFPVSMSANNRDMLKVEAMPDMRQTPILPSYGQLDKRIPTYEVNPSQEQIFEAKVTEAFHYGYTIETTINGKPLRGIVFSYKPGFAHAADNYLTRQSTGDGVGESKLNGNCNSTPGIAANTEQDVDHKQKDDAHAKESTPKRSPMETTPVSTSNNTKGVDIPVPHMASVNSREPTTLPSSPKDDNRHDQPNGNTSKEMLSSPQRQVAIQPAQSINQA